MKKSIIILFIGCACLTITSCKPKLKECRGLVKSILIKKDSLKSMNILTTEGEKIFDLKDARLNEGVMIKDDSVIVNYIRGHHDTLRALVVTVLPKPAHYIDISKDTTKELLTAPVPVDNMKKK